jgi:hypothetical protein
MSLQAGRIAGSSRSGSRIGDFLGLTIALAVAVIGGFMLTGFALDHAERLSRNDVGPWSFWPQSGSVDADPYLRAITAQRAILPMGLGEGISLISIRDDDGERLNGQCSYRIEGRVPAARSLSLSVYGLNGQPFASKSARSAFTDEELLRDEQGIWSVALSSEAKPGNWLPVEAGEDFTVVLRLYDTPLSANAAALAANAVPRILREGCR